MTALRNLAARAAQRLLPQTQASAMCDTECWDEQISGTPLCQHLCIGGDCRIHVISTYNCG